MGTWNYRGTGIALSSVVALLGATVSVLLYYAGQDGLDVFYKDSTYMDDHRRIHKRMPTDDWYGELVLRAWTFGFIFIVPALIGFTASLVFEKILMVVYFVLAVLGLVAGSFLYTAAAYALVLYQVLVDKGIILHYNTWPWDCKYIRYDDFNQEYIDERCETGRRATILLIAAAGVSLLAWVFLLSDLFYSACIFHYIGKQTATDRDRPRSLRQRPRPRRPPATSPTSETAVIAGPSSASVIIDNEGPSTSAEEVVSTPGTRAKSSHSPAKTNTVVDEHNTSQAAAVEEPPSKLVSPDVHADAVRNISEQANEGVSLPSNKQTSPEYIDIELRQTTTERT